MLRGELLQLRLIREQDLRTLYELMSNLETRGSYFPLGVTSEPALRAHYERDGFWAADEGMLLITTPAGEIVGEIEYFPIPDYLQGYESPTSSSAISTPATATRARRSGCSSGICSARKRVNRMQLNIHPDNAASRRVAEKCGFTFEG